MDRNSFSITNDGELTFNSPPDYEVPVDNGGNNVYILLLLLRVVLVVVYVSANQSIAVTVVDVAEAPSAPSAPVLSSPSSTSLLVSWSVPLNTGPAISDYDVGYGLSSGGSFTDWPHSGTSRSATITGLSASTLYYVRVRAVNAEGNSTWSQTASFTTGSTSPPPVTNNPPSFSSVSTFTALNENLVFIGVIVAVDSDSLDSVTGYVVSGGLDSALFSITNDGELTFISAPDYEGPVDSGGNNVYNLIVTATSGTGSRVRTATHSITVTVVDVNEGGPPPATNNPPVFTSSSTFLVNENVRGVGTVVASDGDSLDSVTGYSISGGLDSALFSITNGGVLTFNSAPDYEGPVDSGGNNVYNLIVTVTSGTGSRVRTATQSVTVTVNDVAEGSVVPPQEVVLVYNCG